MMGAEKRAQTYRFRPIGGNHRERGVPNAELEKDSKI